MRVALVLVVALLLGACDHIYGSGDVGRAIPSNAPLGSR